jgi:hypothetical protein
MHTKMLKPSNGGTYDHNVCDSQICGACGHEIAREEAPGICAMALTFDCDEPLCQQCLDAGLVLCNICEWESDLAARAGPWTPC